MQRYTNNIASGDIHFAIHQRAHILDAELRAFMEHDRITLKDLKQNATVEFKRDGREEYFYNKVHFLTFHPPTFQDGQVHHTITRHYQQ